MAVNCVNVPMELELPARGSSTMGGGPPEVDVDVCFRGKKAWKTPAFQDGAGIYKFRFAPPAPGPYTWKSSCSDNGLDGLTGSFEAQPYNGENPLFRHGRLRISEDRRGLVHADGEPFFWLGDTWWMGLCTRLDWPNGFKRLVNDRVEKGFSVIQIVAGPLPDLCATTEAWNPQQANEGGFSWEPKWKRLNAGYYDAADRRIAYLVHRGLLPCIVGMWGYYLPFMGLSNVKKHWRNLVARYGSYPVVWCLAGEASMPTYGLAKNAKKAAEYRKAQVEGWSEVGRYVRKIDSSDNLITIHPNVKAREQVVDPAILDFAMLQTGHGGHHIIPRALAVLQEALTAEPVMPVINAEPCYEGMLGTGWQEVQRFMFWTNVCSGAFGHTYGAQGIWAMSSRYEPFVDTSCDWGEGFWQDAMNYPGSLQVGIGRKFFLRFPFENFVPLEDPLLPEGRLYSYATGIKERIRIYYFGADCFEECLRGMRGLPISAERNLSYRARYFDPRSGTFREAGIANGDAKGRWMPPAVPSREDWLLVLER